MKRSRKLALRIVSICSLRQNNTRDARFKLRFDRGHWLLVYAVRTGQYTRHRTSCLANITQLFRCAAAVSDCYATWLLALRHRRMPKNILRTNEQAVRELLARQMYARERVCYTVLSLHRSRNERGCAARYNLVGRPSAFYAIHHHQQINVIIICSSSSSSSSSSESTDAPGSPLECRQIPVCCTK